MSWSEFVTKSSWGGFGWALLDTVALAPFAPSSGYFRRGGQALSKLDEVGEGFAKLYYRSNRASKLKAIGKNKWKSIAGLIYKKGSIHGNRVKHVLAHAMDSGTKGKSLFNVRKNKVIALIDEAWLARGTSYLSNGKDVYEIPINRIIGTKGETTIRILTRIGSNDIISAYPIR